MKFSLIGIDLAKNVFQVCALDQYGKVKVNRSVSRPKLVEFLAQNDATDVAMEACGSAHYWARQAMAHGHTVTLLPAQHVKPFLLGNKTDRQDALAICEAARRPGIHSVPVKTLAQQDIQLLCRYRSRVVAQRTATCNQIRSFAAEYGVIFPQGLAALLRQLPEKLEADNPLPTNLGQALNTRRLTCLVGAIGAIIIWDRHYISRLTRLKIGESRTGTNCT